MSDEQSRNQQTFSVEGMTCASCVRIVERQLKKIDSVSYVSVNLATEKALVISESPIDEEVIQKTVAETGYGYRTEAPTEDILFTRFKNAKRQFVQALSVTIPLAILMIFHMSGIMIPGFLYMELVGGLYVLLFPGMSVLRGAYIAVTHRHTNMDTLVSIGAVLAWLTAPLVLLGMPMVSFGALSAMLIAFHLTGRYIESKLKYRASTDIRELLSAKGTTANLITSEEGDQLQTQQVEAEALKVGVKVLIRTGERIPLDAEILSGSGFVDASMVTGEPVPVPVKPGDAVIGGTVLTQGSITAGITRVGEDTFLSRMIKMVEEAQSSQVPIQALADRVTKIFIPIILSLAVISALGWALFYEQLLPYLTSVSAIFPWVVADAGPISAAVSVGISVLVIACPCALGLATPMALVAGSGVAARQGMIIKDGEAIQGAKDISIMLLDKTGTITEGRPKVVFTTLSDEQMAHVAALEEHSTHPLALSITAYAKEQDLNEAYPGLVPEQVEEVSGEGLNGVAAGHSYTVGRPREITGEMAEHMDSGSTIIAVESDGRQVGFIAVTDPIKADSARAIAVLREMNIVPVMVTGDQEKTARAAAAQVGITEVHAALHPEDKLTVLRRYQREGHVTAMVGDGINDAAVLKAADIGIALGTGTDLSIESAGIIIVSGSLDKLIDAVEISKKTFRTIQQNLFWAFFYNIVAIPIAAAGLLHPAMAEIAMTFSSINVIVNSMRIRSYTSAYEQNSDRRSHT